jgi:hypothetical protein
MWLLLYSPDIDDPSAHSMGFAFVRFHSFSQDHDGVTPSTCSANPDQDSDLAQLGTDSIPHVRRIRQIWTGKGKHRPVSPLLGFSPSFLRFWGFFSRRLKGWHFLFISFLTATVIAPAILRSGAGMGYDGA